MKLIEKTDLIFIAGDKGMVGSAIKRCLLRKGYSNLITSSKKDLDLSDYESVKKWFTFHKPQIVILAAAKVGGIQANFKFPCEFILENLKIQTNVIEIARENNVKRFLFLGSSCIYPKICPQPIKEESLLTGSLEITNEPYAIAKIAGLKLCSAMRKQYNFDTISLMPTNLYGPGDNYHATNSHVLPSLINKFYNAMENNNDEVVCWGTGNPLREFLHVDDLADASIFALEKYKISISNDKLKDQNEFLNVGTGKDISIKNLASMIAEKIGFKGKIIWDKSKHDGTPRKLLDVSKINKLGWHASISLEKGIEETIKSYIYEKENNQLRF
tara:strand:- start:2087 stop:3073 length:987 start_codon:yes stop_codon:yes gene_type:complete